MTPFCPRCGYDLSGPVAGWIDRCPLEGACTECGLGFEWNGVLARSEHPWLFEYHWRRKPIRRFVRTWLEALRPRRFWRAVKLTDPIHLRPLGLLLGGLTVAMFLAAYVIVFTDYWPSYNWWGNQGVIRARPDEYQSVPAFAVYCARELFRQTATLAGGPWVVLVVMPLTFAVLPQTLGRARVRPAHIVRIWLYGLMLPAIVGLLWAVSQALLQSLGLYSLAATMDPWEWVWHLPTQGRPMLSWLRLSLPGFVVVFLCAMWLGYWWLWACRHYLRLEQPVRIAATVALIALLAGLATQFLAWNIAS